MSNLSKELINSYELEGYENRELTHIEMERYLKAHGISTKIENGILYGQDCVYNMDTQDYTTNWVNTTDWKLFDVYAFLNY